MTTLEQNTEIKKIPFYQEYHFPEEVEHIKQTIARGATGGDGLFMEKNERLVQSLFGYEQVLMTSSGTHALEMAAMLLDIGAGDEVILPSFNFPSAANSILMTGARPVFAEIDRDTMNISAADIRKRITKNTKAIFVTHYAGIACDMNRIMSLAREVGLRVVEDAAQGLDAYHERRPLGSVGDMGCLSFHSTKNLIAGEGGALLLNRQMTNLKERAEILRQKGTNRSSFMRGERSKYTWVDKGSSYCPSELSMAMLYEQLFHKDVIHLLRKSIVDIYQQELKKPEEEGLLTRMTVPDYAFPNYHLFYILLSEKFRREQVIEKLQERGIETRFHFQPLHSSPMGQSLQREYGFLPITEDCAQRLLRLPLYTAMERQEAYEVTEALQKVLEELS